MSKGDKRIRTWSGTISNPSKEQTKYIKNMDGDQFSWFVCAIEYGDKEKNLHLQWSCRLKNGKTFSAMQKFMNLKKGDELAEHRMSEFTNSSYCMKGIQSKKEWEEFGVDGPNYGLEYQELRQIGTLPIQGKDSKVSVWDNILADIEEGFTDLELMRKYPSHATKNLTAISRYRLVLERDRASWRDVKVTYISGTTGDGKTRYVCQKYGYKNVFRVMNYHSGAFDNYNGQDVILFEEFRGGTKSGFKLEQMLNFIDGHPCELPARYADKFAKYSKVYICTNWEFEQQYEYHQDNYPTTYNAWIRRISRYAKVELTNDCLVLKCVTGEELDRIDIK